MDSPPRGRPNSSATSHDWAEGPDKAASGNVSRCPRDIPLTCESLILAKELSIYPSLPKGVRHTALPPNNIAIVIRRVD